MLNPYDGASWHSPLKGDLHFHSNLSDGENSPEEMLDSLFEKGFDFCCLTDHDLPTDKAKYFKDLLVLPGQELSSNAGHVVTLASQFRRKPEDTIAKQLSTVHQDGGFCILSHPRIREFVSEQGLYYDSKRLLFEFPGLYEAIEIYTHNVRTGFKLAIDRLDLIWSAGSLEEYNSELRDILPVWGFASSDGHCCEHIQENTGLFVLSKEKNLEAIFEALKSGAFYSSANSRARFIEISEKDGVFQVTAKNAIAVKAIAVRGCTVKYQCFSEQFPAEFIYEPKGDEKYIRFEAIDASGQVIYSNPVLL